MSNKSEQNTFPPILTNWSLLSMQEGTLSEDDNVKIMGQHSGDKGRKYPLALGRVQAGFATWAEDEIEKDLSLDDYLVEHASATFLVKVSGESMIEAGILPGDVLVVDRSKTAASGNIVIAVVDGDLTVKRLVERAGRVELHAENKKFPKVIIPEGAEVEIWGVVTGVVRRMEE